MLDGAVTGLQGGGSRLVADAKGTFVIPNSARSCATPPCHPEPRPVILNLFQDNKQRSHVILKQVQDDERGCDDRLRYVPR